MKIRTREFLLAWTLVTLAVNTYAQTQPRLLPRCSVAQIIVNGAYQSAQAKQQGQSYDHQVMAVQSEANRLAAKYGDNVGQTYANVETKLLQSLYTNPAYTQMSPEQFKEAMTASYSSGCPQAI